MGVLLSISCSNGETPLNEVSPDFRISNSTYDLHSGMTIIINNASSNYTHLSWYIDNQLVGEEETLVYAFATKGVYEVKLKVCNGNQCEEIKRDVTVKNSILSLLTGGESKTCKLFNWQDSNGNSQNFDSCSTCTYAQSFYSFDDDKMQGRHVWLNNGLVNCRGERIQCNSYGSEDFGSYYIEVDVVSNRKYIFIGEGSKVAYQFSIDEDFLVMQNTLTGEIMVFEPM